MGHLHNGHKKEENFTLCNSMNGPEEYYAEQTSQSEEDKNPN